MEKNIEDGFNSGEWKTIEGKWDKEKGKDTWEPLKDGSLPPGESI